MPALVALLSGLLGACGLLAAEAARVRTSVDEEAITFASSSAERFHVAEGDGRTAEDWDWLNDQLDKVKTHLHESKETAQEKLERLGNQAQAVLGHVREFFEGLRMGDDGPAEEFVQDVIRWGGAYPKLAQRLRTDKAIVRSEKLRDALGRVMENNTPRREAELVDHLLRHLGAENLSRQEVVFEKTLGTGSIAQVALFRIRGAQRLMKMTWPEDEEHYAHDFRTFKRWEMISWGGSKFKWAISDLKGKKLEKFRFFLQAVLTKERDIFNEFDMTREFEATKEGAELVNACAEDVLPAYEARSSAFTLRVPHVVNHGQYVLEQGFAGGQSLEELQKAAASSSNTLMQQMRHLSRDNASTMDGLLRQLAVGGAVPSTVAAAAASEALSNHDAARDLKVATSAAVAYTQGFLPVLGCMLMFRGKAHADAHSGNLRYDVQTKELWVIDWGAMVELDSQQRVGLRSLVTELARGELRSVDVTASTNAEVMLAGNHFGVDLWQNLFDPEQYEVPRDLNVPELMKSMNNPRLVLCVESIALASRMVMGINQAGRKLMTKTGPWFAKIHNNRGASEASKSVWRPSLLSQWSSVANLALLEAAKTGSRANLTRLLQRRTDPSARFLDTTHTVLMRSARVGNPAMVAASLNHSLAVPVAKLHTQFGENALHLAASSGNAASIEGMAALLEAVPLPQERDLAGKTPLMRAVAAGHVEVVKTLLESPATRRSLAVLDWNRKTALSLANDSGHSEITHLLTAYSNLTI